MHRNKIRTFAFKGDPKSVTKIVELEMSLHRHFSGGR